MAQLVSIKRLRNRLEAEIAQNLLESHGIRSKIWPVDAGGTTSGLVAWGAGEADLVVLDVDASQAVQILESTQSAS